jgi:hypothetical protein
MSNKKEKLFNTLITILIIILTVVLVAVPIIIACSVQRAAPLLLEIWSATSIYITWWFWIKYIKFCKECEGE